LIHYNQTSYIDNWLHAIKKDNRMLLFAASQAQKACEFILNSSSTSNDEEAIQINN